MDMRRSSDEVVDREQAVYSSVTSSAILSRRMIGRGVLFLISLVYPFYLGIVEVRIRKMARNVVGKEPATAGEKQKNPV